MFSAELTSRSWRALPGRVSDSVTTNSKTKQLFAASSVIRFDKSIFAKFHNMYNVVSKMNR